MTMRMRATRSLWIALLLALATPAAFAACTSISVTNLVFGTYSGSALSTTAQLTVNCTNGYAYNLGLGAGASANVNARTMANGTPKLSYEMYQDSAHSILWGNTAGTTTVSGTGTGANQVYTIYGLVPGSQNANPLSYSDYPIAYVVGGSLVTISVTATEPASCSISATALGFGTYAGASTTNSSTITVNCTNTTTFNIGLSAGSGTGATVSNRLMTGPSSQTLAYSIFQDSALSVNWGNTVGTDTVSGTGNGTAVGSTAYGSLPSGQYKTPGSYSDTVVATVTY